MKVRRVVYKFLTLFVLSIGAVFVLSGDKSSASSYTDCGYTAYTCRLNCVYNYQTEFVRKVCTRACGNQEVQCFASYYPSQPDPFVPEENADCYFASQGIQSCLDNYCSTNEGCNMELFSMCSENVEAQYFCQ